MVLLINLYGGFPRDPSFEGACMRGEKSHRN